MFAPGVFVVGETPGGNEDGAADGFHERFFPICHVWTREDFAPPVVGHVVDLAEDVERKSCVGDLKTSQIENALHLGGGEDLYVTNVVALPAVDRYLLAVAQK